MAQSTLNMNKYQQNFIVYGAIDFMCLLCKESFEHAKDVDRHIRWVKHLKSMKTQKPSTKFINRETRQRETIYKLGDLYYCKFCNFVTSDGPTMQRHIGLQIHKDNKQDPPAFIRNTTFMRDQNGAVTVAKITLTKQEWHSILNGLCYLCDAEVEPYELKHHITLTSHMIKLIYSQIINFREMYCRQIDDNIIHCFGCNTILQKQKYAEHYLKKHYSNKMDKQKPIARAKQYFDYDRENVKVTCKICNEQLKFKFLPLVAHKNLHSTEDDDSEAENESIFLSLMYFDHGKMRKVLKDYGSWNHIKLTSGGRSAECNLCNVRLYVNMQSFREHVNGARHRVFLEHKLGTQATNDTNNVAEYKTKSIQDYFKSRSFVLIESKRIFYIRRKWFIDDISFLFLAHQLVHPNKLKCYICDQLIPSNDIDHVIKHENDFWKIEIISTFDDEFVREIRAGQFHCAFCNEIYPSWNILKKHLQSWKHMGKKHVCQGMWEADEPPVTVSYEKTLDFLKPIESLTIDKTEISEIQLL